jgi:hypothetical protein
MSQNFHSERGRSRLWRRHSKERTRSHADGQRTFRYDTFGDEAFWGDNLKLHQAIAGAKLGGVGRVSALAPLWAVGLKVDSEALHAAVAQAIREAVWI